MPYWAKGTFTRQEGVRDTGWQTGRIRFFPQGFHHGTETGPEQFTLPVRREIVMIDVVRPLTPSAAALPASTTDLPP